jgi:hypothetical protein
MSRERAKDLSVALLLLPLVFISQWRMLDLGTVISTLDYARDIYPGFHWLHVRFSAGLPVFWDQSSGLGDPVLETLRSAYFYPPLRLITTLFDAVPGVLACILFHYFVAALGAYALARARGASASSSLVACLAVGFAGGMTFCSGSVGLLMPLAYFPWMILGLVLVQDAPRPSSPRALTGAAVLGFATGLAFLSGHIGMGLLQVYALAVLHGAHCLAGPGRWTRFRASLAPLAASALIATLLFAGQAVAMERIAAQSARGQAYSVEDAAEGKMSPATLGEMVLPHLLGQMKDNSYLGLSWRFGTYDAQGIALYAGILSFVLACFFAVRSGWRRVAPWAAAWAFLILYALGDWTPVFQWAILRLPFLGHLHVTVRAASQTTALLCVPMALGMDRLRLERPRWVGYAVLGLGLAFILSGLFLWILGPWLEARGKAYVLAHVVGGALHHFPAAYYVDKVSRCLNAMRTHLLHQGCWALATGLLLAMLAGVRGDTLRPALVVLLGLLLFAELTANLWDYLPTLPRAFFDSVPGSVSLVKGLEGPHASPYRTLVWGIAAQIRRSFPEGRAFGDLDGELRNKELLAPDWNKFYGMDLCNTYPSPHPLRLERWFGWFKDSDPSLDPPERPEALLPLRHLYDLCGAKYFFLAQALDAPGLRLLRSDPVYVYRNERALPLAYVAGQYSDGWDSASAVEALTRPGGRESAWPLPALVEGRTVGSGRGGGTLRWDTYADTEWALDVDSRGPGVLVLSRLYYPGPWKAEVNGVPSALLPANGALCALPLKGGHEHVRVWYQDCLPGLGLALQGLACALAAAVLGLALLRGRTGPDAD